MTQVNVEKIVDHFQDEFVRVLEEAYHDVYPTQRVDEYALYFAFQRAVERRFNQWENVPNDCVK